MSSPGRGKRVRVCRERRGRDSGSVGSVRVFVLFGRVDVRSGRSSSFFYKDYRGSKDEKTVNPYFSISGKVLL